MVTNHIKTEKNPHGAGRPTNEAGKAKFLTVYPDCGTVDLAAKATGVTPKTVYNWINSDANFAAKVTAIKPVAKSVYLGVLEGEAHRRAVEGVDEPVFYKGELVAQVRKYSDLLLIFLMKGAAPEKYRERVEHTGENGGAIAVKIVEVVKDYGNGSQT